VEMSLSTLLVSLGCLCYVGGWEACCLAGWLRGLWREVERFPDDEEQEGGCLHLTPPSFHQLSSANHAGRSAPAGACVRAQR
jgi:hypothetical protein